MSVPAPTYSKECELVKIRLILCNEKGSSGKSSNGMNSLNVMVARPTDPTMVRPYGGTLVVSGATTGLIPSIRELGVPVLEEQSTPVMYRISSRNAPHNLYADTELVRQRIEDRGFYFLQPGPGTLYPFGLNQNNWNNGADKIIMGIGNAGNEGFFAVYDNNAATIQLRGDAEPSFINKPLHIGGTTSATHQLQVTGDVAISGNITSSTNIKSLY